MRILIVHNYHQFRGGDDEATEQDVQLLQQHGHAVELYFRHNNDIKTFSGARKALLFLEPTASLKSYQEIKAAIQRFQPDVVHFQGFFPLVSPAAYYACAACRVPVIQALHDYRVLCAASTFFREGHVCEACLQTSPLPSIYHACYRNSRVQTASVALMLSLHHGLGTWQRQVDAFLVPSEFARRKFVQGGLNAQKLFVRPNFLTQDPGIGREPRRGVLYVGRLAAEKGIETLLEAWRSLPHIPLKIIGNGPLYAWVSDFIQDQGLHQVELLGYQPLATVIRTMQTAQVVVLPSVCYETFGRTILEAYATGTPVIVSDLGAIAELVQPQTTGLLFPPGDATALAHTVTTALADPDRLATWGEAGRRMFEQTFQAELAYTQLMTVYEAAIAARR